MDGNPGTVSMGPGTNEVQQQWWPRASPECNYDNELDDPYTVVSGMVPLPRDEAHEFSEKMGSEALRENLVALLDREFPKGALAVTGHMQVCAANDAYEELPTSSTMTTRTATSRTRTTVTTTRTVAPPALAGAIEVGEAAIPGPTFTTTATTTMDTFAFSAGHCHWCLNGDSPRGPLVDTSDCHTFLQEGRSFVSTVYQDQCLDLYHNMFGTWGLWSCSGADQQLLSQLDEDTWCGTKGETTMCLSRCRQGADGKLSTTTTVAPYNVLHDGVPTFFRSVMVDEWWTSHLRRNASSLMMMVVGMLLVLVPGACLICTCCRAHKEDAEQRSKHQYHNDNYFDVEDRHDDRHHHHHHYGPDIHMGDSD